MFDLIHALRGKKHCDWCIIRPENFIERWAGGYTYETNKIQKIVWWIYSEPSYRIGIWRLGARWHYRSHV